MPWGHVDWANMQLVQRSGIVSDQRRQRNRSSRGSWFLTPLRGPRRSRRRRGPPCPYHYRRAIRRSLGPRATLLIVTSPPARPSRACSRAGRKINKEDAFFGRNTVGSTRRRATPSSRPLNLYRGRRRLFYWRRRCRSSSLHLCGPTRAARSPCRAVASPADLPCYTRARRVIIRGRFSEQPRRRRSLIVPSVSSPVLMAWRSARATRPRSRRRRALATGGSWGPSKTTRRAKRRPRPAPRKRAELAPHARRFCAAAAAFSAAVVCGLNARRRGRSRRGVQQCNQCGRPCSSATSRYREPLAVGAVGMQQTMTRLGKLHRTEPLKSAQTANACS